MKPRKRRKGSAERFLSILLAAVMALSLAPENMLTLTAYAEGTDAGMCEHHRSHTADCGYREAAPCTHEHTDECYTEKTSCIHVHDAGCYGGELPAVGEDREADACPHACTEDSGCVTKELNCTHEHDESCGYAEAAPCGYVCEICSGEETDEGQETPESVTGGEATEGNKTDEDTIEENTTEGNVSENNIPKENIPEENISEDSADAEEGLCPHHEKHTEDCGYGETTPCGYVCKICPVQELIDVLPEAEEITAENAADVEKQLAEIDEAKAELTDEKLDALDTTRYEAAVSALLALEDMEGANVPQLLGGADEASATPVTAGDIEWNGGYFTILNDVTLTSRVSVSGNVTLILNANCKLTASKGIEVTTDNSLTITGDGELEAIGGSYQAGIGGSGTGKSNSGTITIESGTIIAKGGQYAAGIGGGASSAAGGTGGTIIIKGGTVNATGGNSAAGIGGGTYSGSSGTGGSGGNITIENGTVIAEGGNSGAGIGGASYGSGGIIIIKGGTVTATGGYQGAGIGGGTLGSGDTITISGGTVEAIGNGCGAGIGGGNKGSGGNITVEDGIVTATGGSSGKSAGIGHGLGGSGGAFSTGNSGSAFIIASGGNSSSGQGDGISGGDITTGWRGIIFQNGAGQVYGNQTLTDNATIPSGATLTVESGQSLTIGSGAKLTVDGAITNNGTLTVESGGSVSGEGTIGGSGACIVSQITQDMISVPDGLYYNGHDLTKYIKDNTTVLLCGREIDLTGWTQTVKKESDGLYTVTYTKGDVFVTKDVPVGKSGTTLIATLKDNQTDYAYSDIITINATVTPSGKAPDAPAMLTATFDETDAGQVAVYEGTNQVCEPQTPDEGGACNFSIPARDLEAGDHTLIVKYIETAVMAEATLEVSVKVDECPHMVIEGGKCTVCGKVIAATVESGGVTTNYTDITSAWNYAVGKTATITMLTNQTISSRLEINSGNLTLTMAENVKLSGDKELIYANGGKLTLDRCTLEVNSNAVHRCLWVVNSSAVVDITNCSMTSNSQGGIAVSVTHGTVNIYSGTFQGQNNNQAYGLYIHNSSDAKVNLFGGTLTGAGSGKAIWINSSSSQTLGDLLADGYAYKKSDNTWAQGDTLNAKEVTDTVTVLPAPVKISQQPTTATATYGTASETLTITATPTGSVTDIAYKWYYENGTEVTGQTTSTLTAPADMNVGDYKFYCAVTCDGYTVNSESGTVTVKSAPLPEITLSTGSVTYNGNEQKPAVTVSGLAESTDYDISYTRGNAATTDFTNAGKITITVTGKGNYTGTAEKTYTIKQAVPVIAWSSTSQELTYTGEAAQITAPNVTLVGSETFSGTITYSDAESGADYTVLPADVGTYKIKASIAASENYIAAETADTLMLTIQYLGNNEVTVTFNGAELAGTPWFSSAAQVTITASGFTIAATGGTRPTADEITESSITMSAREVSGKTFYFKNGDGYMTDGIRYTLKLDDNPPSGSIELKYKFWDKFLSVISFGHYKTTDKTVTITAKDSDSGIQTTEYVIVTGGASYATKEDLEAAHLSWQPYDSNSKPTVGVGTQSVIYARLTDNVGNVTYLSSDGILIDETAPVISNFGTVGDSVTDEQAQVSITVDETAAIYLAAVPTAEADKITVAAKDVIATCDANAIGAADGTPIADAIVAWRGILAADGENLTGIKDITGLASNTAYTVYAVAVDKVIDMDNTTGSKIAYTGNVSKLSSILFTTKKTLPVIAKAPVLSGTYGQTIKDMLTPGTAKDKNGAALEGTWTVSAADRNKTPSVGTTEEITVTFTTDNEAYDTISVKITPKVSPRSLSAEGVVISQVAGTYTYDNGTEIKPPVLLNTGVPTEGVYISDSGAVLAASDFAVSYSNNINAGTNTAAVTITGKGNYTGSVTREFTIKKASGCVIPDLTGSHTNDGKTYTYTIKPTEGAVYRRDNGGWTTAGQVNGNVFTDITPGTEVTFYAKIPGNENYEEGDAKSITVKFEKLTPAAPALAYTRSTDGETGEITVTITEVDGAQYSFDGGSTWGDANEQDGFNSSQTVTLAIMLKETDTHKESPVQKVTVNLAKKDREAPPEFELQCEPNGETDYTVTIPPTEGCEYSFDGVFWSDKNVKTGVAVGEIVTGYKRYKENDQYNAGSAVSDTEQMRKFTVKTPVIFPAGGAYTGSVSVTITCGTSGAEIYYTTDGSTPTRSSARYTGTFTVTSPATVRAIAIKEGLTDSAVAIVSYTKPGGGSSGGGDSGNDDNDSGGGSGGSGQETDGGNTAEAAPVIPPATDKNPGTETGNKARPGRQTNPGNSFSQETGADTEKPFIKGEDGRTGWDVIRAEEEKAAGGSIINVDMNGATVVPGDIFDRLRGRDITITFDMDNGIIWSVDGKSITTDKAGDIDFSVKTDTDTIPVDIINNVTGENFHIQLSLAHEGEFGFTAVLSINLGSENAGYTASLYYYNESTGELEFICRDTITEDGTASLAFTHASDYVIAIDDKAADTEGSDMNSGDDKGRTPAASESDTDRLSGTDSRTFPWSAVIIGILLAAAGIVCVVFAVRKKKKEE